MTGFATTAVDAEVVLEIAAVTAGLAEIADGRAASGDGSGQHLPDVVDERCQLSAFDSTSGSRWADASAKQRLLGIDVAHSNHHCLVHDQGFDRAASSTAAFSEVIDGEGRHVERFGTEVDQAAMSGLAAWFDEIEQAETTGIAEGQTTTVGEVQIAMVVRAFIARRGQSPGAGHAKMAEQRRGGGVEQQVFCPPADSGERLPGEALGELAWNRSPQIASGQFDARDARAASQQRRQSGAHGLDFRQFWHGRECRPLLPSAHRSRRGGKTLARSGTGLLFAPMTQLSLEGLSSAVVGRTLTVTVDKPFVFRTKTTNHDAGHVAVRCTAGGFQLDNQSRMPCRVNGQAQQQVLLADGDELEIGRDRFRVVIAPVVPKAQPTPPPVLADDEHDKSDTQALELAAIAAAIPLAPTQTCAVCDARLGEAERSRAWHDGDRWICARCQAKGVKPDHLPRPGAEPPPASTRLAPTLHPLTLQPLTSAAIEVEEPTPVTNRALPPDPPVEDETDAVTPLAQSQRDGSDSDRMRQSRRISASRLAAVEPAANRPGLLSKVGKVFGRRDERQLRLDELVQGRSELLAEFGRHALGPGGSLGLPEAAIVTLLQGGTATIAASELNLMALERWRAHRQRLTLLDAEIAALRRALGLGPDPTAHAQSSPALRPDQKAQQERAFAALDGMATDELARLPTEVIRADAAVAPAASAADRATSASARVRAVTRRRR